MIKTIPIFNHFQVIATNRAGVTRAGQKHVVDVDCYVSEMRARRAKDIFVEEIGGKPEPYDTWRAQRPEPRVQLARAV